MSNHLTVRVTLAPYLYDELQKHISTYTGLPNTPEARTALEADIAYLLQCRLGVPPGTFVVTAVPEDE